MDKELIAMCDCPEIQEKKDVLSQSVYLINDSYARKYLIESERNVATIGRGCLQFVGFSPFQYKSFYRFLNNFPPLSTIPQEDWDRFLFLPSVSWLLREIEAGLGDMADLVLRGRGNGIWWAHAGNSPCFIHDSPEKALIHVLLWQKGKVWKDNEWRAK